MARKGRPKKAHARSRSTTRAGRAAPPDFGPPEIQRLRQILNPGQPGLPADPLSALLSRGFIDQAAYNAGRYFSALTAISRGGWNLSDASVAYLYRRMVAGVLGDPATPVPTLGNGHDRTAADHARRTLERMRAALLEDRSGATLQTIMSICVDNAWRDWVKRILTNANGARLGRRFKGDFGQLGLLREGLHKLADMESHRIRSVPSVHAEAE